MVQDARVSTTQAAMSIIGNLAELFAGDNEERQKKAFEINKTIQASMATINTLQAITGALAEPSIVPGERFVKAAAAGTAGALQVSKIMSTKFQSSQSPTSNVSAPPTTAADEQQQAVLRGLQDGGIRQDTSEMQQGGGSQQVYVVESDIRNVGNRVNAIETRSRVG
jgi:hypothetical protein